MLPAYDLYLAAVRQRLVHGEIEAGLRRLQGRAVERTRGPRASAFRSSCESVPRCSSS